MKVTFELNNFENTMAVYDLVVLGLGYDGNAGDYENRKVHVTITSIQDMRQLERIYMLMRDLGIKEVVVEEEDD